jgi:transposase
LDSRWIVLAEDETDILLFPLTRAGWAVRGKQAAIPISGRNDKRTLFGAINIRTGYRLCLERRRHYGGDFRAFLKYVRAHYRSQPIMMLLDEDSSHTAKDSLKTAEKLRIGLLWLPKRSPKLNPMDHIWRHVKREISSLHQYHDIEEHLLYFVEYLEQMSNKEALLKAGVLSENFWLQL